MAPGKLKRYAKNTGITVVGGAAAVVVVVVGAPFVLPAAAAASAAMVAGGAAVGATGASLVWWEGAPKPPVTSEDMLILQWCITFLSGKDTVDIIQTSIQPAPTPQEAQQAVEDAKKAMSLHRE